MSIPQDSTRGTSANSNEPGSDAFDIKNFSSLQRLIEDPTEGRQSTTKAPGHMTVLSHTADGDWFWGSNAAAEGASGKVINAYTVDRHTYKEQFERHNVDGFLEGILNFEEELLKGEISAKFHQYMVILLDPENVGVLSNMRKVYPRVDLLINAYAEIADFQVKELGGTEEIYGSLQDEYMKAFGDYESAVGFDTTGTLINKWFKDRADSEPPASVNPWEMRIGASRFFVPPINVDVSEEFKVGSLSGGALRTQNTPKFNSGHAETVIEMTLYFPNHESIWGYNGKSAKDINFETASNEDIDRFISSLRGLITQFKYAPFLPVRNEYLNRTYDITGVALHSMSIQTVPGFPFCVAVTLQMLKFNFKPYLPPISDFNQAINWGRYRQYVGRAAQKLNSTISEGFLIEETATTGIVTPADPVTGDLEVEEASQAATTIKLESVGSNKFDKVKDFEDGKHFEIYYPMRTPGKVFAPDSSDFRQDGENVDVQKDKNAWEVFLGHLGIDVDTNPESYYDEVERTASGGQATYGNERTKLTEYLETFAATAEVMTGSKLNEYIEKRKKEAPAGTDLAQLETDIRNLWFTIIFESWKYTPFFHNYLENSQLSNGNYLIKEWMVPMDKVPFDWSKVIIEGVSVTLANNIVRLQLQMEEQPVHQHIGGRDSSINVSMLIFGEDELIKFRRTFEHINGLARLEHAHGVLGFLGIKNVITALAGIKYVLPMSFEVKSVPNFPHTYRVNLSLIDFDIFQQQREELSSSQQKQLIEAFGKRNPFFRIKQLWGAFNAYPDFPLSVRDDQGNIVGHLDPDFYFRGYQMYDDDILSWGIDNEGGGHNVEEVEDFFNGRRSRAEEEANTTSDTSSLTPTQRRIKQINDTLEINRGNPSFTAERRRQLMSERKLLEGGAPTGDEGFSQADQPYGGIVYSNQNTLSSRTTHDHNVFWSMGLHDENQSEETNLEIRNGDISFGTTKAGSGPVMNRDHTISLNDSVPEDVLSKASVGGLAAYSQYQSSHADAGANPVKHWELMMSDAAYRDISGRMIRAFPTYMLWLIDEGGRFAGVKLFDNFYGLQSVIDFSISRSEDILGDTLVLRLSNLYSKLTTPYADYLFKDQGAEEDSNSPYSFIDTIRDRNRNIQSGTYTGNDPAMGIVELESIRLKPGVRVHLRMGYSANPNSLQTVFNGTITEVRAGDIVEVIAQSDAIELSPYLNTTNKNGHSGDGELGGGINTGLWMSEPRDLMVRLLSMGSSTFKESLGHATQGMIFSENKFGIRHFGQMLYAPLTDEEEAKQDARYEAIKSAVSSLTQAGPIPSGELAGAGANVISSGNTGLAAGLFDAALGDAATRSPIISVMQSMWTNFALKRDYEIFKRNIYPGNGMGVAQFLGGDTLDGGLTLATAYDKLGGAEINKVPNAGDAGGRLGAAVANASLAQHVDNVREIAATNTAGPDRDEAITTLQTDPLDPASAFGGVLSNKENSPIWKAFGVVGDINDDDVDGLDEVSFRAQTYMKSVWDMFQLCAAMLPNYIVTVRPFEDRSTVFYGKPHWLYTSGLIPITTGIKPENSPQLEGINEDLKKFQAEALQNANAFADYENQMKFFTQAGAVNPYTTTEGLVWMGGNVDELPDTHASGAKIPVKTGKIGKEMHLPTTATHIQLPELPENERHPLYMDKQGGGKGGVGHYSPAQEGANLPGALGAFGLLDPEVEQWYMNMPWPYYSKSPYYIKGHLPGWYDPKNGVKKVLIYAEKTGKACVCAIGEYGPSAAVVEKGIVAGASPDTMYALGIVHGDAVRLGFVPDDTPLGPTTGTGVKAGSISTGTAKPSEEFKPEKFTEIMTLEEAKSFGGEIDLYDGYKMEDVREQDLTSGSHQVWNEQGQIIGTKKPNSGAFVDAVEFDDEEFEKGYENRLDGERGELVKSLNIPARFDNAAKDNKIYYAFEYGAFDQDVPVWIAPSSGAAVVPGTVDIVGITARRLYDKEYNANFAERSGSVDLSAPGSINVQSYDIGTNFLDYSGVGPAGGRNLDQGIRIWHEFRHSSGFFQFDRVKLILMDWANGKLLNEDGSTNPGPIDVGGELGEEEAHATIARFMRFMWQEAYARAWLVVTTNRTFDGVSITDSIDIDVENFTPLGNSDNWDFEGSPVMDLFKYFLVTHDPATFDTRDAAGKYSDAGGQRDKLYAWMKTHNKQGLDSSANLNRLAENLGNLMDQTLGKVWKAIAAGLSGLTALYRISMMQMGQGLDNVNSMQRQANVLNKIFNDSIYYAAGPPGSLLRLADNPFTREYGEPVIEVREPLQRMHYLSSWQHIISNNIVETIANVPTVVTATSDGSYPVTVYFDRGAPPERQVERQVETGLFWDNARGSGFFGFLQPLLHPVETARGVIKNATGSSDELTSKRVALYHLKEGLKDIYSGELVVLGNPDIQPHDLVYLADVYTRMYGMFEVEQVIHHFTPETGFITSITPNAVVTINDPTRWSMVSWVWSWFGVKNMRDDVKTMIHKRGRDSSALATGGGVTLPELAESLEPQMMGHLQYAHGSSALIRDLAAAAASGNMGLKSSEQAIAEAANNDDFNVGSVAKDLVSNMIGINLIADVMQGPWNWVRDNLIDQQGCYIQYLNKDGQAMDAGLSYNSGVAVGRHHSVTILPGILGLQVDTYKDGNKRITSDDLLAALGWNEIDIDTVQRDVSFWVSQTNAQILEAAGKSPDNLPFAKPEVEIVTVADEYFDGDTFHSTDGRAWRLSGVSASEVSHNNAGGDNLPVDETYAKNHIAYQAAAFLRKRLYADPVALGHAPTVAVRIGVNAETYGRQAVVVFHNVPAGTAAADRDEALLKVATQNPMVEWDSYDVDGRPYTINWELIASGLAQTALYGNNFDSDRGAIGIGDQF